MGLAEILDKVKDYLPEDKLVQVEEAYQFASECHGEQRRLSGEPYMAHPASTAQIVAELQLDAACLAAALLHDVSEDCGIPMATIEERFGAEVSRMVDGMTRLDKITQQSKAMEAGEPQVESLRKMFVAMAEDIRVVLVKLADRLHNMRTLKALPPEKQRRVALETMEIYAPLAHRLGMWQLKWELEDLAFRYLEPQRYREITRLVAARQEARERYIAKVTRILKDELARTGIAAEVSGRPKNIYSIHQKMQKYAAQGKEFSDIHDLLALRVLVDEVRDCYSALGMVHSLWHPIPGQFDDFIANPRDNVYQSLHSTVMCLEARPLEIQIRTHAMHRVAEYGVAAHWRYKEGGARDMRFEEKIAWLRQLMEWQRELTGSAFLESLKTDIFGDQVYVYTPKGDIKELPAGAAPLDLAYRIHTELGHRCIGAKVNGRLVSLDYELRSGDTVEILTAKADRGPSRDWLNPSVGYIKTNHAREKIRQWFRRRERAENLERGRELLEKELKRLGISLGDQEQIAKLFRYEGLEEFLVALGCGDLDPHQIALKLTAEEQRPAAPAAPAAPIPSPSIQVLGVGDLLTHIASCCRPVPGDEIIGFVTRTRGVSVHRKDCPNILSEDEKERLVRVDWGPVGRAYPVAIHILAWDRVGLLRDISTVVSEQKVNIASVSSAEHDDGTISIHLTLEVSDIARLSRLFSKLEGVHGMISISRSLEPARREEKP